MDGYIAKILKVNFQINVKRKRSAGKVINIIKCVGGGQWNDGFMYNRKEGERE